MTNETKEPTAPIVQPFSPASRDEPFIGPNRPAAPDLVGPATPTQKQANSRDICVQGDRQREQDREDYFKDLEPN
jgi:hypothetical protein